MSERIWLSYDLGVDGDYDGIYRWLDGKDAVECGDSCASMMVDSGTRATDEIVKMDLRKSVKLRARDRVYLIYKKRDGKWSGKFIYGGRKAAPWAGFAVTEEVEPDEE
jgi:hypothetical protein